MTHDTGRSDELIDLGAAIAETKGVIGPPRDEVGLFELAGISDD